MLPVLTLGGTRDNTMSWTNCTVSPTSWTGLCSSLRNCGGLELHGLPDVGNVEVVLETLCGVLGAVWMKVL